MDQNDIIADTLDNIRAPLIATPGGSKTGTENRIYFPVN